MRGCGSRRGAPLEGGASTVWEEVGEVTEWTELLKEVVVPGSGGCFLGSNSNRQGRRLESKSCYWRRNKGRPRAEGGEGMVEDRRGGKVTHDRRQDNFGAAAGRRWCGG